MTIASVDPHTATVQETGIEETPPGEVAALCGQAEQAARIFRGVSRKQRAEFLRAVADQLEANVDTLAEVAESETALGLPRLTGEVGRTVFQLRAFATVVDEGSYLEITIDTAGDTAMGPRPELRRMLVPVGPVAVFGASNFPFAFSICGGDTAAALAAGCPVVIKAHSSHPLTSQRTFDLLQKAATATGMPDGVVSLIFGREAGQSLVKDQHIKAAAFTGSEAAGRVLHDLATSRPDPIPFYGELGSINPLVVTPGATAERTREIAAGYVGSVTLGGGQFCTKPSLMLVPENSAEQMREALTVEIEKSPSPWLLNEGIYRSFTSGVADLESGFRFLGRATAEPGDGFAVQPALFYTNSQAFAEHRELLLTECFGPVGVVVEYGSEHELLEMISQLPGALVGTVHGEPGEESLTTEIVESLSQRVGRVVWNGYPTGVAVTWGMTHGGPYPATTSLHTSVGESSTRRFMRPVSYQSMPDELLPQELLGQGPSGVPRRLDGELTVG